MKIVAFLQNQWFKNPAGVESAINHRPEEQRAAFRQRFAQRALFMGCLTGKRLLACLGSPLCNQIYWENASQEMSDHASASPPADHAHIRAVLQEQRPDLILAFGNTAIVALMELVPELWPDNLLTAPHPAARGPDVIAKLKELAREIEERLAEERRALAEPPLPP